MASKEREGEESGPSTVGEPAPKEKARELDTQVMPVPLSPGATVSGIPLKELLSDRLVGELLNMSEEEQEFALFKHYMVLKMRYAAPQVK